MTTTSAQPRVLIFDTTLRDGEQSPGATMTHSEKLEIAALLDEMGVDVIEAGFPIASDGDFEAVSAVSKQTQNATICGLARANFKDIDRCWEAVKHARSPRIHTFIGTLASAPRHSEFDDGRNGRTHCPNRDPCTQSLRRCAMVTYGCDAHRT